jgi:acyl-CoA synthetase (AMP-forming)/AMP-acid ligase II
MSTIHYSDYATSDYPQTFGELLDWSLARIPNPETKVYFRITGQTPITYAEFARNVGRICNLFMSLGLRKGDHVAIFLPNSMEYAYLYHALSKCGLVMVPLNQTRRNFSSCVRCSGRHTFYRLRKYPCRMKAS